MVNLCATGNLHENMMLKMRDELILSNARKMFNKSSSPQ